MAGRPDILRSFSREVAFLCTVYSSQLLTQAGVGNAIFILQHIAPDVGIPNSTDGHARLHGWRPPTRSPSAPSYQSPADWATCTATA